jgi:hypothetical protein
MSDNVITVGPAGPQGPKGDPTSINGLSGQNIVLQGVSGIDITTNQAQNEIVISYTGSNESSSFSALSGYLNQSLNNFATKYNTYETGVINLNNKFNQVDSRIDSFRNNQATKEDLNDFQLLFNSKINTLTYAQSGILNNQTVLELNLSALNLKQNSIINFDIPNFRSDVAKVSGMYQEYYDKINASLAANVPILLSGQDFFIPKSQASTFLTNSSLTSFVQKNQTGVFVTQNSTGHLLDNSYTGVIVTMINDLFVSNSNNFISFNQLNTLNERINETLGLSNKIDSISGSVYDFDGYVDSRYVSSDELSTTLSSMQDAIYSALGFAGNSFNGYNRVSPPASSNSPGVSGQWTFDSNYFYLCTSGDKWARIPLAEQNW